MARKVQLHKLVRQAEKLGKKHPIRSNIAQLESIYDSINRAIFNGVLVRPKFIIRKTEKFWGEVEVGHRSSRHGPRRTYVIRFNQYFPSMKFMINTVAHEMVHQWEWEKYGNHKHNKSFYAWNERLSLRGLRL